MIDEKDYEKTRPPELTEEEMRPQLRRPNRKPVRSLAAKRRRNLKREKLRRKNNVERRNRLRARYYAQFRDDAENRGQRWTEEEDTLVLAHTLLDRDLAQLLGRSVQAVQVRRQILRKKFLVPEW